MKFTVRVPATSANLGSGSDCLGLAVSLYLYVTFESAENDSFSFGRGFDEPIPDKDNLVLTAMSAYERFCGRKLPKLAISMESDIPVSRGLGSSSSAIIAGLMGAAEVLGDKLDEAALLRLATELEGHPDNVTPALLGGFTMAMYDGDNLLFRHFDLPEIPLLAAVPSYRLSTSRARAVLPKAVPLKDAIGQLQRAVLLSAALSAGEVSALSAMTEDVFFTPNRKALMPGYEQAVAAAMDAGASCCMTSGAGPTILAFADAANAGSIGEAMLSALNAEGVSATIYSLVPDNGGAIIIRQEGKAQT